MFLFSNSSVGQDGVAITISRSEALRALFEVSMGFRLIRKVLYFQDLLESSPLYSLVSQQGSLIWFSVVFVCREGNSGKILALGWLRSPAEPRL